MDPDCYFIWHLFDNESIAQWNLTQLSHLHSLRTANLKGIMNSISTSYKSFWFIQGFDQFCGFWKYPPCPEVRVEESQEVTITDILFLNMRTWRTAGPIWSFPLHFGYLACKLFPDYKYVPSVISFIDFLHF